MGKRPFEFFRIELIEICSKWVCACMCDGMLVRNLGRLLISLEQRKVILYEFEQIVPIGLKILKMLKISENPLS